MKSPRIHLTYVLVLGLMTLEAPALAQEPDGQQDSPSEAVSDDRALALRMPEIALGGRDKANDKSKDEFERDVENLLALAAKAGDTVTVARLNLAAANLLLSLGAEPACSLAVQFLELGEHRAQGLASIERAHKLMANADAALADFDGQDHPDSERIEGLLNRMEKLRGFAAGMRAVLEPGGDTDEVREAATELSLLLEDSDPQVAAAAALYNAHLRRKALKPDRVLPSLDIALAPPKATRLPYDFFSRLLRCELIAQRGGHSAALALLMQMEILCDEWFARDEQRDEALRSVTVVELHVLREWHRSLGEAGDDRAREWCAEQFGEFTRERLSDEPASLLRLGRAIPILVTPPDEPTQGGRQGAGG